MTAHKLQGRLKLYGLDISIENAKGSVRRWYDPHGKEKGSTKMHYDYGYIRGTKGTDGDHVDVYVGPNPESDRIFIVDQMKKPSIETKGPWTEFDEQKVMLAFKDAASAKAAYFKQYDDPRFFGGMKEMSVADFKTKVLDRENYGKKIAQARLLAELNLVKLSAGEPIALPKKKKEVLGTDAGVDALPPMTAYSEATMSKDEREAADDEIKSAAAHSLKDKGFQPRMEHYRRHVAKADKRQVAADAAWDAVEKKSSGDRAGRIADRIDDVGIGLLAAPYAADAGSRLMMRVGGRNAKVRAAATALKAGFGSKSRFGHSAPRELAGLAMVAPGVTHTLAKGIDKVVPQKKKTASGDMLQYFKDHPEKLREKLERQKKAEYSDPLNRAVAAELESRGFGGQEADDIANDVEKRKEKLEKIAQTLFDDYEYKTEAEKVAIIGALGRMAGTVARAGQATARGAKSVVSNVVNGPSVADRFVAGYRSSQLGRTVSPQALQRGRSIAASKSRGDAAFGANRILHPEGRTLAEAPAARAATPSATRAATPRAAAPRAAVARGGVPTPVPATTAAPAAAPSAAPAAGGSGKWNPLSTRNVLLGGAAAGVGLGAYGGYKGIQTVSNILSNHHEAPLAPPGFVGPGRAF